MIKTKSFQRVLTCALSLVMALTCVCVPAFAADDMTEPNPSIEQHPDDTMNPTKVVTVIGEKAFYKVENGVVIYADRDDGSGWEAVPSAYIKGSEYNEGDIDFGMYVVGADEVRFVALDECHDEGDGTFTFYHGTKDSATVSEDVDTATNDDPSMGTQFYINIEDGIDPDGPSKEEVVNPGTDDARVEYEVTVSTKTNYQLNATVPMYVCMYGFRGTGSVVTPSKDAYQLKNYSTINENSKATIVDITKLTHYARIYDENHSDENLYAIAYDAGTYTYWYSNPGDEELAKHEAHLVLTDRNINASGEVYVIFIDNEWDFKAAGVLTGDCLRETVNAIDPNHPLSEDLVYGEFNFGKEFAVGAAVEGGEDKGLAIEAQVRWDDSWQEGLWDKYRRILAPDGVVVLFSSGRRTAQVITGATIPWRYNLVWHKVFNGVTPLTQHEDICVFSHFAPAEKQPRNFPSILSYPVAKDGLGRWRAKPLDLCQKLICNYSEFDGRVLDNCMGEGIVGKAALRMGRQFVGIEKDVQKFRKACKEVHSVEYAEGIVN